jgi:type I restriction enzyme M protein
MARAASKPKKEISMEEALWKSADKLRGSVEPAEYKHVVLSLFFLKFASDKFEAQRKAITVRPLCQCYPALTKSHKRS